MCVGGVMVGFCRGWWGDGGFVAGGGDGVGGFVLVALWSWCRFWVLGCVGVRHLVMLFPHSFVIHGVLRVCLGRDVCVGRFQRLLVVLGGYP